MSYYTAPKPGSKIIIVGGGAFGLSTAYALALKKKYDIWVFDRAASIPAPDAASTDISKAVRMDYGNQALYLRLMLEALPLWDQWNKERATQGQIPVYHESGVLIFGRHGQFSQYEQESMRLIREAGYGNVLQTFDNPQSIIKRFPYFKDAVANGYDTAYLNTRGGWCNSSEAIKHVYQKCLDLGVQLVLGPEEGSLDKLEMTTDNKVVGIRTKNGQVHLADKVVLATGAWTSSLLAFGTSHPAAATEQQPTSNGLTATGQIVVQFKPAQDDPAFTPKSSQQEAMPVWLADSSRTGFYGFPMHPENGLLKVALHGLGYLNPSFAGDKNVKPATAVQPVSVPRTQLTHPTDTIPVKALHQFRSFLADFFPATSAMDVHYARVCWYSDSADCSFLVAPHPSYQNLVVASGDSGHGMKFLPIIGFKIGQVIEGQENDYTRAWQWRDSSGTTGLNFDGMRPTNHQGTPAISIMDDPNDITTHMATSNDLKAPKARL
ncbi:sarcosine oxidase [Lichtheimia corymbifera JMRC:FSU:9682]|uniref:Sarcosine oxidase n=1 Tax=Lichtheimia corymbifera JMRC:FSU:9682 TaxID=1263082 RepID=A0A068RME9_9FUNG|nr:sarcosine oxidase [Lichtheimia corymbifera JMRC:FSU:9682]